MNKNIKAMILEKVQKITDEKKLKRLIEFLGYHINNNSVVVCPNCNYEHGIDRCVYGEEEHSDYFCGNCESCFDLIYYVMVSCEVLQ